MQYDPVSRLSRHIQVIQSRPSRPSELVDTLRLTRLVIEKGSAKERFPTLAMYCDWVVHSELDRSAAWQFLRRMDVIWQSVATAPPDVVIAEIGKGLGLAMLRSDFYKLLNEKGIDTSLFTVIENWIEFQQCLLTDLLERPIKFPDDIATSTKAKGRKVYDAMLEARVANGHTLNAVRQVAITFQPAKAGRPAGFYWHVRIRQETQNAYAEANGHLGLDVSPLVPTHAVF